MLDTERTALEKKLAYQFASRLPQQAYQDWAACRHTTRHVVYAGSIFVLWQSFMDEPMIVGSVHVVDVRASFKNGLEVCLEWNDSTRSGIEWVGHTPNDILGSGRVFAHVPFRPEVSFLERSENAPHTLRIPLVFRTQGNPNDLVEGQLQVTQVGLFRAAYPQFREIRL